MEWGALFLSLFLGSVKSSKWPLLPCGKVSIESSSEGRLLSHRKFNKKSKYPPNSDCTWSLHVGASCLQVAIWCPYLQTIADKKCKKGDILRISGTPIGSGKSRLKKYCKNSRPKKALVFRGNVVVRWASDKKKQGKGFDCRVNCRKAKPVTSTTTTTTTKTTTTEMSTIENTKTIPPTEAPGRCLVESGPGKGRECVFPFKWAFNSKVYDGCAFDPTMDLAPWCSTKVVDGVHQTGKGEWGYCDPACPLASGVSTPPPTTPHPNPHPGIAYGCDCGKARRGTRIINGRPTEVNEYPWMTGLGVKGSLSPMCGAALVSDQFLLTAAHCCSGKVPNQLQAFLGDHDWMENQEVASFRRAIQEVLIHPQYSVDGNLHYDVCLLKLDKPISFPDHPNVRPICLPSDSNSNYANSKALVAGWGKTGNGNGVSTYLQEIDLLVWAQKRCRKAFGSSIADNMMCVSKKKKPIDATCNGDSGGSVMHLEGRNYESIGIVSWGVEGCQVN